MENFVVLRKKSVRNDTIIKKYLITKNIQPCQNIKLITLKVPEVECASANTWEADKNIKKQVLPAKNCQCA